MVYFEWKTSLHEDVYGFLTFYLQDSVLLLLQLC